MKTYDLIVIGGGPAGTTLATLVAKTGHKVLLLERTQLPRYQIGESLLPATVDRIASLLGIKEKIQDAGFIVKRGATFSWGQNPEALWTLNFGRSPTNQIELAPNTPFAYNVPRTDFDCIFLDNARAAGVEVLENHKVDQAVIDNGVVKGVEYTDNNGKKHRAYARFVADASGKGSILAPQIGTREFSRFFRKVSVFGYFNNGGRIAPPLHGNVLFQTYQNAWIWYIPLSDTLTSVGVVMPAEDHAAAKKERREILDFYIAHCPLIQSLLADAHYSDTAPFNEIRSRSEFSYCNTRLWMPGGLVIGDAGCFVDVLLSSGIHLATYAALLAARSINSILDKGMDEALCFNEFEARVRKEYAVFFQGLVGLYDMGQNGDSYVSWLRTLLRDSNGVYIEWNEQKADPTAVSVFSPDMSALSERNVAQFRDYNAWQVQYDGPPVMNLERPIPEMIFKMQASHDDMYWVGS